MDNGEDPQHLHLLRAFASMYSCNYPRFNHLGLIQVGFELTPNLKLYNALTDCATIAASKKCKNVYLGFFSLRKTLYRPFCHIRTQRNHAVGMLQAGMEHNIVTIHFEVHRNTIQSLWRRLISCPNKISVCQKLFLNRKFICALHALASTNSSENCRLSYVQAQHKAKASSDAPNTASTASNCQISVV